MAGRPRRNSLTTQGAGPTRKDPRNFFIYDPQLNRNFPFLSRQASTSSAGGPLFTFSGFYDNLLIVKCQGVFMQKKILFDKRLSLLRKQAGISQKQLGEVIGLSNKAICTMENGTRETTFEKLVLLAEYFHVSTDYLLGVTDTPTPKE